MHPSKRGIALLLAVVLCASCLSVAVAAIYTGTINADKVFFRQKPSTNADYHCKLSKGTHSVRFNFVNGYAESTLKVTGSGSGSTPGTGDDTRSNDLVSGMILFIVSLSFVAYTLYENKLTRAKLLAAFSGAQADVHEDGFDDIMLEEHMDDGFDDIIADGPADDRFDDIIE